MDISFDSLKASGAIPHWFGLGFVQLKINEKYRLHFWHPEHTKNVPDEEVHNHRYDFTSKIIVGEMIHEVWSYREDEKGDSECVEVSCSPEHSVPPEPISKGFMTMTGRYTMIAGSEYFFPATQFHRTTTKKAVTFLCRQVNKTKTARVLRPIDTNSICPFSVKKTTDECWQIIQELLHNEPRLSI